MKFKRRKLTIIPPIVSMADIAFNLVLFFLILAKTTDDSHLQWQPAKAAELKPVPNSKVSIIVDKDSRVYFNGEEVSTRGLAGRIEKELENLPPLQRTVQLKIHQDTLASTFEPIMEAVSNAGGEIVHVLDEENQS